MASTAPMKNWKTTAFGVIALVGVVCKTAVDMHNGKPLDFQELLVQLTGIAAGVGLIHAQDGKAAA